MEGTNARLLTSENLGGAHIDLAVSDLSFISQTLIYPAVFRTVSRGGVFISLIKPQFEAGREHLNKNGIVRDRNVHESVIKALFHAAEGNRLYPEALMPSPIAAATETANIWRSSASERSALTAPAPFIKSYRNEP